MSLRDYDFLFLDVGWKISYHLSPDKIFEYLGDNFNDKYD